MPCDRVKTAMEAGGISYQAALTRFSGNEALLQGFIREFPGEGYLQAIQSAMERGDDDALQTAVHTLKGTAGSLGMTALYSVVTSMMAALHGGNQDGANKLFPRVATEYEKACQTIRQAFSE